MTRLWQIAALTVCLLAPARPAAATEVVHQYLVDIQAQPSGDISVTETIAVRAETIAIKHGIFRVIPGEVIVLTVTRDGAPEHWSTEQKGDALNVVMGDPDRLLDAGDHTFVLSYQVGHAVVPRLGRSRFDWRMAWPFPVEAGRATLTFPAPVTFNSVTAVPSEATVEQRPTGFMVTSPALPPDAEFSVSAVWSTDTAGAPAEPGSAPRASHEPTRPTGDAH